MATSTGSTVVASDPNSWISTLQALVTCYGTYANSPYGQNDPSQSTFTTAISSYVSTVSSGNSANATTINGIENAINALKNDAYFKLAGTFSTMTTAVAGNLIANALATPIVTNVGLLSTTTIKCRNYTRFTNGSNNNTQKSNEANSCGTHSSGQKSNGTCGNGGDSNGRFADGYWFNGSQYNQTQYQGSRWNSTWSNGRNTHEFNSNVAQSNTNKTNAFNSCGTCTSGGTKRITCQQNTASS